MSALASKPSSSPVPANDDAIHQDTCYDDAFVARLELVWGDGMLSPGGATELNELLRGQDLRGATLLDIGCGTGGFDLLLLRDHGVGQLTGIDIEGPLLDRARAHLSASGLASRAGFLRVDPGPLPFDDASFDVVFSKDAIIHVADKAEVYREALRVLKPGGRFIASDWLRGASPGSAATFADRGANGMPFHMACLAETEAALAAAGFTDLQSRDRGEWFKAECQRELDLAEGPLGAKARLTLDPETFENWMGARVGLRDLAVAGHLRPAHLFARCPL